MYNTISHSVHPLQEPAKPAGAASHLQHIDRWWSSTYIPGHCHRLASIAPNLQDGKGQLQRVPRLPLPGECHHKHTPSQGNTPVVYSLTHKFQTSEQYYPGRICLLGSLGWSLTGIHPVQLTMCSFHIGLNPQRDIQSVIHGDGNVFAGCCLLEEICRHHMK